MAYFLSKNPNLGKFGRVLQWKMLVYYMGICYILWPFVILCGYLAYIFPFWYVVQRKHSATLLGSRCGLAEEWRQNKQKPKGSVVL
jgi:hypothetical protein